ncbi:MAG: hypothetical protein O7I93_01085 [Gemmatimonadetes bacterium]|nr:hypothetical protein [Gemmatimonadota bacterium]
MKTLTKLLALPLVLFVSGEAQAQEFYWAFQYGMSAPMGDTKTFTPGSHWRNFGVDGRYVLKPNLTVGFHVGWSVMNDITAEVVSVNGTAEVTNVNGADIGGVYFRYLNSFPVMANIHYYFGKARGTRPYIGINAGPQAVERRVEVGLFQINDNNWHFGFAPEAGVVLPFDRYMKGLVNVKYNHALAAGEFGQSYQYWTFNIGIAWATSGGF